MYRESLTDVDEVTATRIANLWNDVIGDMLTGLRTDLYYFKEEDTLPAEELKILVETERTLYHLDSGERNFSPIELRDAVQAWLAYYFRSAEEPTGMPLAPVYRLAAELSDLAEALERADRDADSNDPWATGGAKPA